MLLARSQCCPGQGQAQSSRPCAAAGLRPAPGGVCSRQLQHQRWSAVLRTACLASTSDSSPSPGQPQDYSSRHPQPRLSGPSAPGGGDGRNPVLRWLRIVAKALRIALLRAQLWATDLGAGAVQRCRSWLGRTRRACAACSVAALQPTRLAGR